MCTLHIVFVTLTTPQRQKDWERTGVSFIKTMDPTERSNKSYLIYE